MSLSEISRDLIVASSSKLFSEHGLKGVSLKMISDSMGIPVSALSPFFGSKEEIYREIIKCYFEKNFTNTRSILGNVKNVSEFKNQLRGYFESMADSLSHDIHSLKIVMLEAEKENQEFYDSYSDAFNMFNIDFYSFLKSGEDLGIYKKMVDIKAITNLFWAIITYQLRLNTRFTRLTGDNVFDKKYHEKWIEESTLILFCRLGID